jgi:hypothetical protein
MSRRTRIIILGFAVCICAGFVLAVQFGFITFANSCPPDDCDEYYYEASREYPVPDPISNHSESDSP